MAPRRCQTGKRGRKRPRVQLGVVVGTHKQHWRATEACIRCHVGFRLGQGRDPIGKTQSGNVKGLLRTVLMRGHEESPVLAPELSLAERSSPGQKQRWEAQQAMASTQPACRRETRGPHRRRHHGRNTS